MNDLQKLALKRIKKINDEIEVRTYYRPSGINRAEDATEEKDWENLRDASFEQKIQTDARTKEIGQWVDALLSQ
jgi:CRISPR/Cas system-associated protein Cas7 (RAMP superfamily)